MKHVDLKKFTRSIYRINQSKEIKLRRLSRRRTNLPLGSQPQKGENMMYNNPYKERLNLVINQVCFDVGIYAFVEDTV